MLDQLQLAIFIWAAVCQTLFVAVYGVRPWWLHFIGRALFIKSLALMLLVDMAVVHALVEYPGKRAVETAMYALVAVAIAFQLVALLAHGGRRTERDLGR